MSCVGLSGQRLQLCFTMDDEADTVKTSPKQNSGGGIVINMNDDD